MGKVTVAEVGTIKIKMDVKDDVYYDAKDPHVSFVRNGRELVRHCNLDQVDDLVGTGDSDLQEAIRYVRQHKEELKKRYQQENR